ncbi:MAG TPA: hypothetical protein VGP40_05400, partial [Chthoniobacterales bacterium]|nr:hypothetical protein [Chthoniobacterales bacterium]
MALTTAFAQTTTQETTTSTTGTGAGVSATTTTGGTTGVTASTSTLDGTGTITTYTPGSDYITMNAGGSPTKYYYTKSTTVVDPTGATVDMKLLRPDLPVKYTYVKEGDRMVISKITVQKPVAEITKETTTTTTTSP